jgi:hypothetical protein
MKTELNSMKFRKKPVVIDAMQWTGENLLQVIRFTGLNPSASHFKWDEYAELVRNDGLKIFTLEGKMSAGVGDWIIKGVKGEFYPCKEDIFNMTYELAKPVQPCDTNAEIARIREQWEAERNFGRIADESRLEIQRSAMTRIAELEATIAQTVAVEREACAVTCENIYNDPEGNDGYDCYYTRPYIECAADIRARGQS